MTAVSHRDRGDSWQASQEQQGDGLLSCCTENISDWSREKAEEPTGHSHGRCSGNAKRGTEGPRSESGFERRADSIQKSGVWERESWKCRGGMVREWAVWREGVGLRPLAWTW